MTEKKKAPTTTRSRRQVSLGVDPLDEAAVPSPAAPAKPSTSSRRSRTKDAEVDLTELAAKPGEMMPGEETFKLTVNIPVSLHQRASGVVRHAEDYDEPEGIESLTDLVRNSLANAVSEAEKSFNNGEPFRAPKRLRRGRRTSY